MRRKDFMKITLNSTPSSKKNIRSPFAGMSVFDIARSILENHIKEAKGQFITDMELPIPGPLKEQNVLDAILALSREKDPLSIKLLQEVAGCSNYEKARLAAREVLSK